MKFKEIREKFNKESVNESNWGFVFYNKKSLDNFLKDPYIKSVTKNVTIDKAKFRGGKSGFDVGIESDADLGLDPLAKKVEKIKKKYGKPGVDYAHVEHDGESISEADIKKVGPKMAKAIEKLAKEVGKKDMDYKDYITMAKLLKTNWTNARKFYQPLDTYPREEIAMALKKAGFKLEAEDIFQIQFRDSTEYKEGVKIIFEARSMSQKDLMRKFGNEYKKALRGPSMDMSDKAEEALQQWVYDNYPEDIKTDDPDEWIEWLDKNLEDFVKGRIK